jgi:hypothetical protein
MKLGNSWHHWLQSKGSPGVLVSQQETKKNIGARQGGSSLMCLRTQEPAIVIIVCHLPRGEKKIEFFDQSSRHFRQFTFHIFQKKIIKPKGGVAKLCFRHFSSSFTIISAHTNFHDPRTRTTSSGRKVIRRRRGKKEKKK